MNIVSCRIQELSEYSYSCNNKLSINVRDASSKFQLNYKDHTNILLFVTIVKDISIFPIINFFEIQYTWLTKVYVNIRSHFLSPLTFIDSVWIAVWVNYKRY